MKKGLADDAHVEEDFFVNPYSKIDEVIEKKRRNLEKRKIRLQQYEKDEKDGKKLIEEQVIALSRMGEVETQIEFVKEILKLISTLQKDYNRSKKQREEALKKEQVERERKSIAEFLKHQGMLKTLSCQDTRKAFVDGSNGAIKLEDDELAMLDFLNDCFNPSLDNFLTDVDWEARCVKNASNLHAILHGTKEKVYEKKTGLAMKGFLDKIATCQYVKDLVTNSLTAEDENTENDKPPKDKDACVKEDPKVVFVQGEREASKEPSETDATEATTTEFGYESYTTQDVTESPPAVVDSVQKIVDENDLGAGDHTEYTVTGNVHNEAPVAWVPPSNSEVKPEKVLESSENTFADGAVPPQRMDRKPRGGGNMRGGNRYRDNNLPKDGIDRRRVPKDGRQVRNYEAYGQQRGGAVGRGGRGAPGRGGFSRGGMGGRNRVQNNSHMNDLTNGYSNGAPTYGGGYSYRDANPPRRIGLNFASDFNGGRK